MLTNNGQSAGKPRTEETSTTSSNERSLAKAMAKWGNLSEKSYGEDIV